MLSTPACEKSMPVYIIIMYIRGGGVWCGEVTVCTSRYDDRLALTHFENKNKAKPKP